MARPNVRGRQVVRFRITGSRVAEQFGLPDHVRGIVQRYAAAKTAAVDAVSAQAVRLATDRIVQTYTIDRARLDNRLRIANTPDTFRLLASSLRFPLALFGGVWGGAGTPGATASVLRGQGRTYAHAFIAPGRFRGAAIPLIYTRVRGAKVRMTYGRYKGQLRERIRNLRGPSPYAMLLGRDASGARTLVHLATPLAADLRHAYLAEIARYVGGSAGRGR